MQLHLVPIMKLMLILVYLPINDDNGNVKGGNTNGSIKNQKFI